MDLVRAREIATNTSPSIASISDQELAAYTEAVLRDAVDWLHPHLTGMVSRERAQRIVLERYRIEL
jgi:hypothetical protein